MELRHLRYFTVLAEELHFGRAAARLGISQPPLSQQIRALEDEVSARLFERTNRRVELTEAGRLFLVEARAILERASQAVDVVARAQRGEAGEIQVGLFGSVFLHETTANAVLGFRRGFPAVRLVLRTMPSGQQLEALAQGDLHVGFIRSPEGPPLPPGLTATELFREPLVALMRREHPLAGGDGPLPVAALAPEAFVAFEAGVGSSLPEQLVALCRGAGFEPRIEQEAKDNGTLIGLVAAGFGIAIFPASLCRLSGDALCTRTLDAAAARTSVWLAHRQRVASPAARTFIEHVRTHCGREPPARR